MLDPWVSMETARFHRQDLLREAERDRLAGQTGRSYPIAPIQLANAAILAMAALVVVGRWLW